MARLTPASRPVKTHLGQKCWVCSLHKHVCHRCKVQHRLSSTPILISMVYLGQTGINSPIWFCALNLSSVTFHLNCFNICLQYESLFWPNSCICWDNLLFLPLLLLLFYSKDSFSIFYKYPHSLLLAQLQLWLQYVYTSKGKKQGDTPPPPINSKITWKTVFFLSS